MQNKLLKYFGTKTSGQRFVVKSSSEEFILPWDHWLLASTNGKKACLATSISHIVRINKGAGLYIVNGIFIVNIYCNKFTYNNVAVTNNIACKLNNDSKQERNHSSFKLSWD